MINLESVGTGLDTDGMTYTMLEGGGYDTDNGIHLIEKDGEWVSQLSEDDRRKVDSVLFRRWGYRGLDWFE